jgi:tetratricopeptide (TPR) repeat protein
MKNNLLFIGIIFSILSIWSVSVLSSEQTDKDLKEGILLLGAGSYDEALEKFLKVQELDPLNADAYYYIGSVYSSLAEFEKAISAYQKVLELNPELKEVHFKLGVAYYQLKQYREAIKELEEAEKYAPEDAMVYYYQGAAYYGLKRYYKSTPPFAKVRELDPTLTVSSYYWEGISLFQQGLYAEAEYPLREVRRLSPDSRLGRSASEFLQAIEDNTKAFCFDASVGVEYDDNVTLQPVDEDVADISDKEDERAVINLKLTRQMFLDPGEFGISYSFYQSLHEDLTDYDVQGHTGSLYFASALRPFQPSIQYNYDYYFVDQDKYLEKHTIVPSLNISVASPHITQVYFQYENMNYLVSVDEDEYDRSGYANSVGLNQYFSIIEDKGYIKLGGEYKKNEADGDDWDYSSSKFVLSVYSPLPFPKMNMEVGGEYIESNFDNEDSYFEETRRDRIMNGWIEFIYKLNDNWNVALSYKHTKNNSNIDFYEHRRNITSLFASYSF